jgi:RNA polymerase sigma factor for flagellar operon FliA
MQRPADSRDERAEALRPLVHHIARRLSRTIPSAELDELVSDGYVGLMRAIDAFDPNRGASVEPLAVKYIEGAMLKGLRRMTRDSYVRPRDPDEDTAPERPTGARLVPFDAELSEHNRAVHGDRTLGASVGLPLDLHEYDDLIGAVQSLSTRHQVVISMHYFHERGFLEIGQRLSVTRQRASQLHAEALARLRAALSIPESDT